MTASKGGISSGAIAGAAIGGVCGAVVIVAIIWLLCRRRGRRVAAPNSSTTFTKLESTPPPDKEHYERTPVELENLYDGSARAEELPGWTMRQELSGQPPARELG